MKYSTSNIKMWHRLGSCGAFGMAAMELGETDPDLAILTADLCFYSGLDRFRNTFPNKLYNIGIAEQNMVGIAGGMAKEGLNVFATTYGTFASTRCADQVRVNMGYMRLPIKLVGLTSGLSTGILGATHISCEDIAIMRSIPNITVLSPADTTETVKATLAAAKYDGPVYLRLTGKMGGSLVYKEDYDFEIGKAIRLRDGNDITIFATGPMVAECLKVADLLAGDNISCSVVDVHTIKPLDTAMIRESFSSKLFVSVEEHSTIGGLGSAISEIIVSEKAHPRMFSIGIADEFKHAADYDYLLKEYGLTSEQIYEKIKMKYMEV